MKKIFSVLVLLITFSMISFAQNAKVLDGDFTLVKPLSTFLIDYNKMAVAKDGVYLSVIQKDYGVAGKVIKLSIVYNYDNCFQRDFDSESLKLIKFNGNNYGIIDSNFLYALIAKDTEDKYILLVRTVELDDVSSLIESLERERDSIGYE